jgi:hypothetical protein
VKKGGRGADGRTFVKKEGQKERQRDVSALVMKAMGKGGLQKHQKDISVLLDAFRRDDVKVMCGVRKSQRTFRL